MKTVLIGITGSIAAYKMADLVSSLAKKNYNVKTIMTKNATKIIKPIVFSTLSGNKTIVKTFDKATEYKTEHISLAEEADVFLVAPATANIIAKLATGIADDMLTTTALACTCPKLIAPAMNAKMYQNPVVQKNLKILESYGWTIIEPDSGVLACKEEGIGKLPKPEILEEYVLKNLSDNKDLKDKKVLITAGPTREAIDPVRFISNRSSGKMGFALAQAGIERGAEVTLVTGPTTLKEFIDIKRIDVETAKEMFEEVISRSNDFDIIIMAAAVADFVPEKVSEQKIKKQEASSELKLKRTTDILKTLGEHKRDNQFICGFSMETSDLVKNSTKKLEEKNSDMICANSLVEEGSGFMTDTNIVTLIDRNGVLKLEKMSKLELAHKIYDKILSSIQSD